MPGESKVRARQSRRRCGRPSLREAPPSGPRRRAGAHPRARERRANSGRPGSSSGSTGLKSGPAMGAWDPARRAAVAAACAALLWAVLVSLFGDVDAFPGGSIFAVFAIFVASSALGTVAELVGLPPLVGGIVAGFCLPSLLVQLSHHFDSFLLPDVVRVRRITPEKSFNMMFLEQH